MKNYSDTIGNRTRGIAACSAVPQSTAPPLPPPYIVDCVVTEGFVMCEGGGKGPCETLLPLWLTTRYQNPEDHNLNPLNQIFPHFEGSDTFPWLWFWVG
jgi:hypothetical protein